MSPENERSDTAERLIARVYLGSLMQMTWQEADEGLRLQATEFARHVIWILGEDGYRITNEAVTNADKPLGSEDSECCGGLAQEARRLAG